MMLIDTSAVCAVGSGLEKVYHHTSALMGSELASTSGVCASALLATLMLPSGQLIASVALDPGKSVMNSLRSTFSVPLVLCAQPPGMTVAARQMSSTRCTLAALSLRLPDWVERNENRFRPSRMFLLAPSCVT